MAAEFIGYSVLVTLREPHGYQLEGVVANVVDQKLSLRNVHLRWTGQRIPSYDLNASLIADLEILRAAEDELRTPTGPPPQAARSVQHAQQPPASFVDPAIVSYNRTAQAHGPKTPVSPVMIADGAVSSPARIPKQQSLRGQSSISSIATARRADRRDSSATATLTGPFDALGLDERAQSHQSSVTMEKRTSQTGPGIIDMRDIASQSPVKQQKKQGKQKGWRSTPLIEERPAEGRRRGRQAKEDANGWATEEATDIAEMGEFDFEGNHAKFDKRKVFDDIRRDDTTADEDRLVSFNKKKPLAGTNGGRNLHFTENVLDQTDVLDPSRWKSEAGETEDEVLHDGHYSSGRNSRRAGSRRPVQSRKGSALPNQFHPKEQSPRPLTRMPTGSPLNGSVSGAKVSLRISPDGKPCHAVSPLQMLELEQLCTSELGLTEEMLTENAGRSLAEAIFKAATPRSGVTLPGIDSLRSHHEIRNVLFLLSNHKASARALAAARQLRNRRIRVTVCLVGLERGEDQLLEIVRKQLKVYRLGLGHVERWEDYQAKLTNAVALAGTTTATHASVQPPDFIVESLLGVHHAFDEFRTDDQATIYGMIKWANLSVSKLPTRTDTSTSVPILSIDVPSGISAMSGIAAEADGQPLVVSSSHIVCLGAPKAGLLAFLADDQQVVLDHAALQLYVADIGISVVAWQRNGSRRKQGVDFGGEWVLPLKLS